MLVVLKRWMYNWLDRHRNRVNFALHVIGIPATIAAVPMALMHRWLWAVGLFIAGYALQFIGHAIEGNRSGEEEFLRKLFNKQ